MDGPSAQLHLDIRDSLSRALALRRPILHHLNADTTWLLQLPRPASAVKHGIRFYYNILIDPWLVGGQSDVARWFSQQWHATESSVKTVAEIEELAREIEILAGGLRLGKGRAPNGPATGSEITTFIDAVAISHEFTDHCHKETLLEILQDVPVFATEKAAALINSWSHFRYVHTIPHFTADSPDWRSHSLPPLPEWISISRITASSDALYYHSAIMIAFSAHTNGNAIGGDENEDTAEAVIYTPHGVPHDALAILPHADPPIRTLAFLHGLHSVSIGNQQQLNLGGLNGLKAQRSLNARYWVGTHDEVKKGGGLVSWFLRRKIYTLEEALQEERASNGVVKNRWEDTVAFEELRNGESMVLL